MKNKVLVNVAGSATRKIALFTVVNLGYDFIEFQSPEDLKFKHSLLKDSIIMLLHEINYATYERDFEMIKEVSNKKIKVLLIIDRYETKVIDDAIEAGANDIIVLPLKEEMLKSKIKNILANIVKPFELEEDNEYSYIDDTIIDHEIIRADRGNYSISLVMVELHSINEEEIIELIEKLKSRLRETDLVMRYGPLKLLLICPFTGKENIVEVENKVRMLVKENFNKFKNKASVTIYGISYPKDGERARELIELLDEGIMNSRLLGRIRGTFSDIRKEEIETYKKLFNKKY
ncbi:MAG: hypothetical protein CVU84_16170 [Firmicutes bacterium HGW-Firmicutes-1]|jgi:PleD family two-component response regulator|nr:MAG: hypothetical protein CVU84_16170 [Firmicutes bacterium HGW-Firmicutes-1]